MTGQMNITKEQSCRLPALSFLKTSASIADTTKLAAFFTSDRARLMTGRYRNQPVPGLSAIRKLGQ